MRCRKAIGTLDVIPKSQGTGTILRWKTHEKAATPCCRILKGEK